MCLSWKLRHKGLDRPGTCSTNPNNITPIRRHAKKKQVHVMSL